ncbi:TPA: glycosyltransferase, partial [Streptococcus suis]
SELALSSSKREGLPVNLIEAMATGLPLVVSNCRGNRDLVETGQNGIVLKEATAEAFADAVEQLIDDEELYQSYSADSYRKSQNHAVANIKKDIAATYN